MSEAWQIPKPSFPRVFLRALRVSILGLAVANRRHGWLFRVAIAGVAAKLAVTLRRQ
jgi:hypothetical protein